MPLSLTSASLVRKTRIVVNCLTLLIATLFLFNCESGIVSNEYGSWSFSGYVVDGSSQERLSRVDVLYQDKEGEVQKVTTDKAGRFFISSLPFGDRSFQFVYKPEDADSCDYTRKIVLVSSYSESRSIDGLLGDVSQVVTLYPLRGSVNGEVFLSLKGSEKTVPAKDISVKVAYTDSNLNNSTPVEFSTDTDSSGAFSLSDMPVAPGAVLKINSYTFNDFTYSVEPVDISQLFASRNLSLGRIYLSALDSTNMLISEVKSNVLSSDGFGLSGVAADETVWYVLPGGVDMSTIDVSLSGGEEPGYEVDTKDDTVFINPVGELEYDSLFTTIITGLDTAGNYVEFVFDKAKRFRTEKDMPFQIRSNVLTNDGYGLTGVSVGENLWYVLPKTPDESSIEVFIDGKFCSEAVVDVSGDTLFIEPAEHLSYDTVVTVSFSGLDTEGNRISYTFDGDKRFRTEVRIEQPVKSNVMNESGFGLNEIPVNTDLWYVLPLSPLPSSVTVSLSGGGNPNCKFEVAEDTIHIDPSNDFEYGALITVLIKGTDTSGTDFNYLFDGAQRFKTEENAFVVGSNTWRPLGSVQSYYSLNDTLWVRFSETLDSDVEKVDWSRSPATYTIYGRGANTNADVWINGDTLFVCPDQRLSISYGQTMGFSVNVVTASGKRTDTVDVVASIVTDDYYIKWTNTKDALGNMRQDFGTLDSVVVVSNAPIDRVIGISGNSEDAVPPDLALDNVHLRGDTIVYKPSLYLKPDSIYGLDFDVLFEDGNTRYDILGVRWKTDLKVKIRSFDNRESGSFRKFGVIGDSLSVTFSSPIDTGADAAVPFRVNMTDVRYRSIDTRVKWSSDLKTVTIFNIDTLPTADFDASPAYTVDAVDTRAVRSVSFDLVTQDGEQVLDFKPENENIQLHTEKGLCVIDANILQEHDIRNRVDRNENSVSDFAADGSVRVTFNRVLDTAAMRANEEGLTEYAGIKDGSSTVASAISFSSDGKTIIVTPDESLSTATDYKVYLRKVPASGISSAKAIHIDAGTFSGKSSNQSLLDDAFQVR